jgi:hypothetical protein
MTRRSYKSLCSARWFVPDDLRPFGNGSRLFQMGYSAADWKRKPVIAIVKTWSDINMCDAHPNTIHNIPLHIPGRPMGREIAIQNSLGGRDNIESQGSFRPPALPRSAISGEVDPRRTWWLNPRVDNPHFAA